MPTDAKGSRSKEFHPAPEEYCEAIWGASGVDEIDVDSGLHAERLEVSRPAVSEMIRRMEAEGLIDLGATITLTSSGRTLAERVVRRHRLAERFLTDVLGLLGRRPHRGRRGARGLEPVESRCPCAR